MAKAGILPVYVLYGSDAYERDRHRGAIIAEVLGGEDAGLGVSRHEGTAELADVLDDLRTPSLMAGRRAVIVSDADAFVSAYRQGLERYLETPAAIGSLVLEVSSWPSNTNLAKKVAKIGRAVKCAPAEGAALAGWIADAAARRGVKIAPAATEMLATLVGKDMAALDSEVEKLSLYVGQGGTVELEHLSLLVTATAGPEAFGLSNAITAGDAKAALEALDKMLTGRGAEFQVLGSLGWHVRRSLGARRELESGGRPHWSLAEYVRRRGQARLAADCRRLLETDLAMKSGADALGALQKLVVELCW